MEKFVRAADCFRQVLQHEPDNRNAIRLLEETFFRWGQQSGSHENEEFPSPGTLPGDSGAWKDSSSPVENSGKHIEGGDSAKASS